MQHISEYSTSRKAVGRTTVVHLSDLHAPPGNDYDGRVWAALREDLKTLADRVDLLVATGDLIDNPWRGGPSDDQVVFDAMQKVAEYLVALCADLRVDATTALTVVPGNHDYRRQGLFRSRASAKLFKSVFERYIRHALYPELRMVCFAFDSNSDDGALNLAAGLVRPEDIVDFSAVVETVRKRLDWPHLTKLALVHHHPMPIGPTEHRTSIAGRAEHMLLKNAGLFLEEMVKARVDLILHGHHHYAAMSKACYPVDEDEFHTVSVLAGGSVGVGQPPTYYVLNFEDSGEVHVEQRSLTRVTYDSAGSRTLMSYEAARLRRIDALKQRAGARLALAHYGRMDRIEAGSGDDFMAERMTDVVALGEQPVASMPHRLSSRSGILGDRAYHPLTPGHRIRWEWLGPRTVDGAREAETHFEPPLTRSARVSFERTGIVHNAIHFNARDRRDVTEDDTQDSENVQAYVSQVYGAMSLQVVFPEGHWPGGFRVEAIGPDKTIDRRETEWVKPRLSVLNAMRSVTLAIDRPLPAYSYRIVWDLPPDETSELPLDAVESGRALEIVRVLLSQRQRSQILIDSLERLRIDVLLALAPTGDPTCEVGLLVYDPKRRGLVSVGAAGHAPGGGDLDRWVVKVGSGIEGQSYRRRQTCWYVGTIAAPGSAIYSDLPDSSEPPHTLVVCVPLFYPIGVPSGRRVAVLRICTRANNSGLLRLATDGGAGANALADHAHAWLVSDAGKHLGLTFG